MDYAGAIEYILNRLETDLPVDLHYHGHHHTKDVLEATERIARSEGITGSDLNMVLVAAAYHDCGFIHGPAEHEKKGCEIVEESLPNFGFELEQIDQICEMIMATKVPQDPKNELSQILCDADLDYLGRDDFEYVAKTLFDELKHYSIVTDIKVWNRIQVSFLTQHHYHTAYGKKYRQPEKQLHLEKLNEIVKGYGE
jgi:predicted metal-dependent HD superfamily phosphohydrolase